jgi:M6 family metalloprotease-like protein
MRQILRSIAVLQVFVLCLVGISAAQDFPYCGVRESASLKKQEMITGQPAYWGLTTQGTVKALFLFIDFPDDDVDPGNSTWPVGVGPNYLNDIIDSTETQNSGKYYNVSTYYRTMSYNRFTMIGKAYYKQAPHPLSWYVANHNGQESAYAAKDAIVLLDNDIDFADYDRFTNNGTLVHGIGPDQTVDMVIVCYRRWYLNRGNYGSSFIAIGWMPLSVPGPVSVDNGARYVYTGVNVCEMMNYELRFEIITHELGHHWNLPHTYTGGVWTVMGWHPPSFCMNSFEKNQLGWLDQLQTITTDGETRTLYDFATAGAAAKVSIPGTSEYFLFENHQLTTQYDHVDRAGGRGVYILQCRGNVDEPLRLVNADGRWNWTAAYWMQNPWGDGTNPADIIPVFRRLDINRTTGVTDRGEVNIPKNPASQYNPPYKILAWLGEQTGQLRIDSQPISRVNGDGKDMYTLSDNVFSPWSASAACTYSGTLTTIGAEITGQVGNDVIVKYYTQNPINAPPSRPQDLHAVFSNPTTVSLMWAANVEPDVTTGGGYDVYRSIYYDGATLSYTKVNSSRLTSPSFTDHPTIPGGLPMRTDIYWRYAVVAVDNTDKSSVASEDAWLLVGERLATGGTVTYSGGYTIHTFTSNGTFTCSGPMDLEVLVVAGGGGGGCHTGGGGGAGGVVYCDSYSANGNVSVTVGAGGSGSSNSSIKGTNGSNSVFGSITAIGGGGGASRFTMSAGNGGSGGGGSPASLGNSYGSGTPGQGYAGGMGGNAWNYLSGGGGGATAVGNGGTGYGNGNGGAGAAYSISGSTVYYGGGGGGGVYGTDTPGAGGIGGGGAGSNTSSAVGNGAPNSGGGGGGGGLISGTYVGRPGGNGGSGIVIVSYPTIGKEKSARYSEEKEESIAPPKDYVLSQNYPNPFNPSTVIEYQIKAISYVTVKIYDMLGRQVATLVEGMKEEGYYTVTFDGSRLSSGVYFARFVVQPQDGKPVLQVKKLLLMK